MGMLGKFVLGVVPFAIPGSELDGLRPFSV
jgi:hypothetical protein